MNTPIRHRIKTVLTRGPMTPTELHREGVTRHGYPWHIDAVCMALRQMERDGEVVHATPETVMLAPPKLKERKVQRKPKAKQKPKPEEAAAAEILFKHLEQTVEPTVKKTDEVIMSVEQSLSELEQRLTQRQIENIEQKLKVLRRLAELLAPDIGDVLSDVAEDLERVNG